MLPFIVHWRRALMADKTLSDGAKVVGFALAEHMNGAGGSCYPSMRRLATEVNLDRRTIQRDVALLEAAGYIKRTIGGGRGRPSHYTAALPETVSHAPPFSAEETVSQVPPFSEEKRRHGEPETAAPETINGGTSAARGLKEVVKDQEVVSQTGPLTDEPPDHIDRENNSEAAHLVDQLLAELPDANEKTRSRLHAALRAGVPPAAFADARALVRANNPRSPAAYACTIVDDYQNRGNEERPPDRVGRLADPLVADALHQLDQTLNPGKMLAACHYYVDQARDQVPAGDLAQLILDALRLYAPEPDPGPQRGYFPRRGKPISVRSELRRSIEEATGTWLEWDAP